MGNLDGVVLKMLARPLSAGRKGRHGVLIIGDDVVQLKATADAAGVPLAPRLAATARPPGLTVTTWSTTTRPRKLHRDSPFPPSGNYGSPPPGVKFVCDRRPTAIGKVSGQRTRKDELDSRLRLPWLAAIRE
jgi:hypothetical protein